jgi:hypothetical protein
VFCGSWKEQICEGESKESGRVFFGPLLGSSFEKVLGEKKVGLELGWWVGGWVKIVFIRV